VHRLTSRVTSYWLLVTDCYQLNNNPRPNMHDETNYFRACMVNLLVSLLVMLGAVAVLASN
jgi:heme A synthase